MSLKALADVQDGLITADQCRALGLTPDQVKHLVRSRTWRTITRGVYLVDADLLGSRPLTRRRLIRAAQLAFGPDSVIALNTAADLHDIQGIQHHRPTRIHVTLDGPKARPRRVGSTMLVPHQLVLNPNDVVEVDGIRTTSVLRTVADLMLTVHRFEAVSVVDHALNRSLITEADLSVLQQMMVGRRGAVAARKWLTLADCRAESPLETRVRLRCIDAGVPPDDLQAVIEDETGRAIARVDMLWRDSRLVGEADGAAIHDAPEAVFRDRIRQNDLIAAGFAIVRFTWKDTTIPYRIPSMVNAAMRRRR